MLYHYTDRLSMEDIRRDGAIRAHPITLFRDVLRRGERRTTPPIVWLSTNPILEGTVVSKMIVGGWPKTLVGDLWRSCLPTGYAGDLGLGEYTGVADIDPGWWTLTVRTGALVGSDYTTWRIVPHDVPVADWLGVEVLASLGPDGLTTWEAR